MEITNLKIRPINYPYIKLTWDYSAQHIDNENNYIIRIGFSENDNGPFQRLVELPFNEVLWLFKQSNTKFLEFVFFSVELFNTHTKEVVQTLISGVEKPYSPIVDKIENKYRLLLKNRIGNKVIFFKKKKAGYHCRKCWDYERSRVLFDNCDVCFETGYGNNSLINLEKLYIDGILKNNKAGYLEFYKRNFTFNFYKLNDVLKEDAGVAPGDIFQVTDINDNIIYANEIKENTLNGFAINDKNPPIFENLENLKFNVFRYKDALEKSMLVDFKIINLTTKAKIFYKNDFLAATTLKLGTTEFTIDNLTSNGFELNSGDFTLFKTQNTIEFYNGNQLLLSSQPNAILYLDNSLTSTLILDQPINIADESKFFMSYYYDGINKFKINEKQFIVGENTIAGKTPSMWSLLDKTTNIFNLELVTLSNYEKIFTDDSPELFEKIYTKILSNNIYLQIKSLIIRKALEQIEIYLKPNTTFFLPHTNILKDYFRGCGVLAINLSTGVTYRGQLWTGGWNSNDDEYDFYVNPETGELNTLSLPKGPYEIKYIFEIKDIKFDGVLNYSEDGWSYYNSKIKNIDIPENIVLAVGTNKSYKEFNIKKYYPSGKLLLESLVDTDNRMFYDTIEPETNISLDYKSSGGYYIGENSYINYMSDTARVDLPSDSGVNRIEKKTAVITMDIQLNTGDLVYDVLFSRFYSIDAVNENSFKGRGTHQHIQMSVLPFNKQALLSGLLKR